MNEDRDQIAVTVLLSCSALAVAIGSLLLQAWMYTRLRRRSIRGRVIVRCDEEDACVFVWIWNDGPMTVPIESATLVARLTTGEVLTSALVREESRGPDVAPNEDVFFTFRSLRQLANQPVDYRTAFIQVRSKAAVLLQLEGPAVVARLQMAAAYAKGRAGQHGFARRGIW